MREREGERGRGTERKRERERGREGENSSRLCAGSAEPDEGLELMKL